MEITEYKPSEVMKLICESLRVQQVNAKIVTIRGIYFPNTKPVYSNIAYDKLRDESLDSEIEMAIPINLRENLKQGNVINASGIITRRVIRSTVKILFEVSRVQLVSDESDSSNVKMLAQLRQQKKANGFRNIDTILRSKIIRGEKPRVCLVFTEYSIVSNDFEKGVADAHDSICFEMERARFSDVDFCSLMQNLDTKGYDAIAVVCGGGSAVDIFNHLPVVKTLSTLKTPWIYGAGHEDEHPFARNVADKVIPIPFALGVYFAKIAKESIRERKKFEDDIKRKVDRAYIDELNEVKKRSSIQANIIRKQKWILWVLAVIILVLLAIIL